MYNVVGRNKTDSTACQTNAPFMDKRRVLATFQFSILATVRQRIEKKRTPSGTACPAHHSLQRTGTRIASICGTDHRGRRWATLGGRAPKPAGNLLSSHPPCIIHFLFFLFFPDKRRDFYFFCFIVSCDRWHSTPSIATTPRFSRGATTALLAAVYIVFVFNYTSFCTAPTFGSYHIPRSQFLL